MVADFSSKPVHGGLFKTFCDVLMGGPTPRCFPQHYSSWARSLLNIGPSARACDANRFVLDTYVADTCVDCFYR